MCLGNRVGAKADRAGTARPRNRTVPEEIVKPKKPPRAPAQKNDPALVAKTRDLRDRYLEFVNSGKMLPQAQAKYEVRRTIEDQSAPAPIPLLPNLAA